MKLLYLYLDIHLLCPYIKLKISNPHILLLEAQASPIHDTTLTQNQRSLPHQIIDSPSKLVGGRLSQSLDVTVVIKCYP